ncbi:MAG: hypothetical protein PHW73_06055 [Atribacterota bacterium]|nr:hypothetical protein [Atribacterota bacterium]
MAKYLPVIPITSPELTKQMLVCAPYSAEIKNSFVMISKYHLNSTKGYPFKTSSLFL